MGYGGEATQAAFKHHHVKLAQKNWPVVGWQNLCLRRKTLGTPLEILKTDGQTEKGPKRSMTMFPKAALTGRKQRWGALAFKSGLKTWTKDLSQPTSSPLTALTAIHCRLLLLLFCSETTLCLLLSVRIYFHLLRQVWALLSQAQESPH